ncbi:hypothetical protein [Neorhizobium tomejilense]|uniref:hypothetical protein n=1 Tax=Neorhizobium tomejilense TaxID=2093828 RepID=UPI000CF962B3|nr:hypothetical protein [Neorhizobium tomejilense]
MNKLTFIQLNEHWEAAPNAPSVNVKFSGSTAELWFLLNPRRQKSSSREAAIIRFTNCSRWNWDATNDHAWFSGEGRYAKQAPKWGSFYEIVGEEKLGGCVDWEVMNVDPEGARHFLFYFRDETLEFIATDWSIAWQVFLPA